MHFVIPNLAEFGDTAPLSQLVGLYQLILLCGLLEGILLFFSGITEANGPHVTCF